MLESYIHNKITFVLIKKSGIYLGSDGLFMLYNSCYAIAFQSKPLANIRKIDCALLPPCQRTLEKKLQRAHYVTVLWSHANLACPDQGLSPTDYGWSAKGNLLQPVWFDGPAIPDALFRDGDDNESDIDSTEDEEDAADYIHLEISDGEAWSEDSDTDSDDVA